MKKEEGLEYAKKEAIKWDGSETADTAMWRAGKGSAKYQNVKVLLSRVRTHCIINGGKFMKAKLMALILAAGLGITGIAMTTQAAQATGASTMDTCRHENLYLIEHFDSATYNDGNTHWSTYSLNYHCSYCHDTIFTKKEDRLERHDYEQIYYHDGSVISTCLDCKYTY